MGWAVLVEFVVALAEAPEVVVSFESDDGGLDAMVSCVVVGTSSNDADDGDDIGSRAVSNPLPQPTLTPRVRRTTKSGALFTGVSVEHETTNRIAGTPNHRRVAPVSQSSTVALRWRLVTM
jgi:hypothetical protein